MNVTDPMAAAIAALHGDDCVDEDCACEDTYYERAAQVVIAAVRPLIEAEVREQVARELEAAVAWYPETTFLPLVDGEPASSERIAAAMGRHCYAVAAAIARGGAQ